MNFFQPINRSLSHWLSVILLVTPLVIQTIPLTIFKPFFIISACLLALCILNFKTIISEIRYIPAFCILAVLYFFTNIYGLLITEHYADFLVIKEIIWGCLLIVMAFVILTIIGSVNGRLEFLKSVNTVLIFLGTTIVFISLGKYFFWEDQIIISFFITNAGTYPLGSSLVGDINFFGLSLLIYTMVVFAQWLKERGPKKK